MNTLPAPPRMPEIVPPAPTIQVQVSAAQVWSAAVQNIGIAAGIVYLIQTGRVHEELGMLALGGVAGIDLVGRFKAKVSPLAALSLGASTIMNKLPHLLVTLALGTALFGCGTSSPFTKPPQSAEDVALVLATSLDTALWACSTPVLSRSELAQLGPICQDLARAKARLQGGPIPNDGGLQDDDAGTP